MKEKQTVNNAQRKFLTYKEAAATYGFGLTKLQEHAKKAGAVYKLGGKALVNTVRFEEYLEQFRLLGNF